MSQNPATLQSIAIDKIKPSPYQARKGFDPEGLQDLANSMKAEGLIQPICVRPTSDGGYELIAGERRLRASKLLGWQTIEAVVAEGVEDQQAAIRGLVENLQRKDLNPIEEARAFKELSDPPFNMSHQEIAQRLGIASKQTVSRAIALLEMPKEIQDLVTRGTITETHTRFLRQLADKNLQIEVARQIDEEDWSVKKTEKRVKELGSRHSTASVSPSVPQGPLPPLPDPLADLWAGLHARVDATSSVDWQVNYGVQAQIPGWLFFVRSAPGAAPQTQFSAWFHEMAKGLDGGQSEVCVPEVSRPAQPVLHDTFKEMGLRYLPQTPEELKELEDLAAREGPRGVYARLYGADNPICQIAPKSWEATGDTPAAGCRQILEGIRQLQALGQPVEQDDLKDGSK